MSGSPRSTLTLLPLAALLIACGDTHVPTATSDQAVGAVPGHAMATAASGQFIAHLTGDQEVTEDNGVDTRAQGQANFRLSRDGSEIRFRVNVANIMDLMMAHIHLAPAGVNGPVVVWLYPDGPPPQLIEGRTQGVLARGVITGEDLVGPLADMTLSDLVDAMKAGNTYVNVHTTANPGGEIRGQIR